MSSDSDKEEEEEEEELSSPYVVSTGRLEEEESLTPQEVSGIRLPRRRWSSRTGSTDGVLMVKSMLDLRLLDSYSPDTQEEPQEVREVQSLQEVDTLKDSLNQTPLKKNIFLKSHFSLQVKIRPVDVSSSHCSHRGRGLYMEAELGSTISLQVSTAWVRTETLRSVFFSKP